MQQVLKTGHQLFGCLWNFDNLTQKARSVMSQRTVTIQEITKGTPQKLCCQRMLLCCRTVVPAVRQEELWNELLHICRVAGHTVPGVWNAIEHAVGHIKLAILQAQ